MEDKVFTIQEGDELMRRGAQFFDADAYPYGVPTSGLFLCRYNEGCTRYMLHVFSSAIVPRGVYDVVATDADGAAMARPFARFDYFVLRLIPDMRPVRGAVNLPEGFTDT